MVEKGFESKLVGLFLKLLAGSLIEEFLSMENGQWKMENER